MIDQDPSCRICRGEATESQPLFNPCNCRGSIKYVHQDCLFEWLKHSNKSTQKCDICNTEYKFKTIYDPEMPLRIPLQLILSKFIEFLIGGVFKSISITLYVTFLFQLPMFWKFAGRIYTWAIDGTLPVENPSIFNALLLGRFDIVKHKQSVGAVTSMDLLFVYAEQILQYTYYSGVRHIFVFLLVHIALFIEHEWVVRDEGYTKSLLKRIGKEPRTKLLDMLQQALTALRTEGDNGNAEAAENVQQLEMLARAIGDLQHDNAPTNRINTEEELRRTIQASPFQEVENNHEAPDDNAEGIDGEIRENDINGNVEIPPPLHRLPVNNIEIDNNDLDDDADAADAAEEAEAVAAAAAANANGGDILELFGFALNIKTPILLTIVADSIIAIYLFVFYFIPHMLGSGVASASRIIIKSLLLTAFKHVDSIVFKNEVFLKYQNYFSDLMAHNKQLEFAYLALHQYSLGPAWDTFSSIFIEPNSVHSTFLERLTLLSIGYGIIGYAMYTLMNTLSSGNKPVMGSARKFFKVLFEITSTVKVFFIFAIEIVLFPMYCGWLLDFCGAPVILPKFSRIENDGSKSILLLLSSITEFTQASHTRLYGYWVIGTAYMLCIAVFVGMVRNKILRPGVLFFIRSPEDPNARLIHDALVKPLMLQLSRIYLSAKVYTIFILAGIGGITWGLRLSNMEDPSEDISRTPSPVALLPIPLLAKTITTSFPLFQKYVHLYWKRVFEISAHKMRLSHFILGKPVSQERGYVVYRNIFLQFLGTSQPDYSRPTTYREALKIFEENPQIQSCFVPNGSYVRVPDNDTVSRKYVKKLFVAVTKDDKLISPRAASDHNPQYENETATSDEDEDVNTDNRYTIVYRPPNFKLRSFGLLTMLWGFAIILCISLYFMALLIGRPVVRAFGIVLSLTTTWKVQFYYKNSFPLNWNVDIFSLTIGFQIMVILLTSLDRKLDERQGGRNEVQEEGALPVAPEVAEVPIAPEPMNDPNRMRIGIQSQFILAFILWCIWITSVHLYCVEIPARYYFHKEFPTVPIGSSDLLLNRITIPIHILVSYWTIFAYLKYPVSAIKIYILQNAEEEEDLHPLWLHLILTDIACVWVPFISSDVILRFTGHEKLSVYNKVLIFGVFALIKAILGLVSIYDTLLETVKNENYVRGRTIQNIDE